MHLDTMHHGMLYLNNLCAFMKIILQNMITNYVFKTYQQNITPYRSIDEKLKKRTRRYDKRGISDNMMITHRQDNINYNGNTQSKLEAIVFNCH